MIIYENMSTVVSICVYGSSSLQSRIRTATEKAIDLFYEKTRKEPPMILYDVIVWDQETKSERAHEKVQATTKENAKFEVLRKVLKEDETPDDLDVFVGVIGQLQDQED